MRMQYHIRVLESPFRKYAVPSFGTLIIYHRGWAEFSVLARAVLAATSLSGSSSLPRCFDGSPTKKTPHKNLLKGNTRRVAKQNSQTNGASFIQPLFHRFKIERFKIGILGRSFSSLLPTQIF